MESREQTVLQAVARFSPIEKKELELLVPEYKPHQVELSLEQLTERGFITQNEEDKIVINTNPFKIPHKQQVTLKNEKASQKKAIDANLPQGISTDETITLELTPEQTKLFEKMRANVSRDCGYMDKEEFLEWVFREARRMTEV